MKECIILAGGFGTRLQSVVNDVPKCMALIADRPFLEHIFNYLEKQNFTHVILSLGYKAEVVTEWIKTQQRDFQISFVLEHEPLGTGGAIQFGFSKVTADKALVINGDTFFDIDTDILFSRHEEKKSDISLALKPMTNFDRYGSVELNKESRIIKFLEKKQIAEGLINGGVYLINKSIFKQINLPKIFSFEKSVLESKLKTLTIQGIIFDKYFIDIGIPADYAKANIDFREADL